jgi:hypothetical protein
LVDFLQNFAEKGDVVDCILEVPKQTVYDHDINLFRIAMN